MVEEGSSPTTSFPRGARGLFHQRVVQCSLHFKGSAHTDLAESPGAPCGDLVSAWRRTVTMARRQMGLSDAPACGISGAGKRHSHIPISQAESTVCDEDLSWWMRGTKCSCEHSQCRGSLAQATTFDQIGEGFSAILTGVSLRGIAERGHEAKLSANPANSAALSGQKDM